MMQETLADSLLKKVEESALPLPLPSRSSIYRVPETLRRYNEVAPNLVSIGPFHHGRERLQAMEKMKLWYLNYLRHKLPPSTSLADLIHKIKDQEYFCRYRYEEKVDLSSDEFVEIMLVDGCFIIELLCKWLDRSRVEDDDAIFKTQRMLSTIKNDLLLVENQLPWRVLDCLFKATNRRDDVEHPMPSLRYLALLFFQNTTFLHLFQLQILEDDFEDDFESSHLLETVRNFVVQPYKEVVNDIEYRTPIPSVSELLEIGVKFVAGSSNYGQLGITFRNGVMERFHQ